MSDVRFALSHPHRKKGGYIFDHVLPPIKKREKKGYAIVVSRGEKKWNFDSLIEAVRILGDGSLASYQKARYCLRNKSLWLGKYSIAYREEEL